MKIFWWALRSTDYLKYGLTFLKFWIELLFSWFYYFESAENHEYLSFGSGMRWTLLFFLYQSILQFITSCKMSLFLSPFSKLISHTYNLDLRRIGN
jgi:hypothetical protein